MKLTNELLERTEILQAEMLKTIEQIRQHHPFTKCSFNDLVNVYILMLIAEQQLKDKQYDSSTT